MSIKTNTMSIRKSPIVLRLQINKVLWITLAWSVFASLQFWYNQSVLMSDGRGDPEENLLTIYLINVVVAGIAGLIGGSVVVFFFEKWIRIWPFWKVAFGILIAFTIVFLLTYAIGFIIVLITDAQVIKEGSRFQAYVDQVMSFEFLRRYVIWLVVVLFTLFGLTVNDKYGPGTIGKLLSGKYFKPLQEERVFMFLDLRSSTQVAESLGEIQYFKLLNDVIRDATAPILETKGEIYQYVGDEIVISWPTAVGQHDANCLRCFFGIQNALENRGEYYRHTYGFVPEYKAGLHDGTVIAGEIGLVKRDIAYAGDVLNTTARIQSKCNELGVDILLSKHLLDKLQLVREQFDAREIGLVQLRGKAQNEMLFTV